MGILYHLCQRMYLPVAKYLQLKAQRCQWLPDLPLRRITSVDLQMSLTVSFISPLN